MFITSRSTSGTDCGTPRSATAHSVIITCRRYSFFTFDTAKRTLPRRVSGMVPIRGM